MAAHVLWAIPSERPEPAFLLRSSARCAHAARGAEWRRCVSVAARRPRSRWRCSGGEAVVPTTHPFSGSCRWPAGRSRRRAASWRGCELAVAAMRSRSTWRREPDPQLPHRPVVERRPLRFGSRNGSLAEYVLGWKLTLALTSRRLGCANAFDHSLEFTTKRSGLGHAGGIQYPLVVF